MRKESRNSTIILVGERSRYRALFFFVAMLFKFYDATDVSKLLVVTGTSQCPRDITVL
jgi:hypothetical protein